MVDPRAQQGLPPGIPPAPGGAAPGGPPMPMDPNDPNAMPPEAGAPPMSPLPTAEPESMMAVIAAILLQDQQQFEQMQQAALGTAVTELLRQQPNQAGIDASSGPPGPTPPPMPAEAGAPDQLGMGAGY